MYSRHFYNSLCTSLSSFGLCDVQQRGGHVRKCPRRVSLAGKLHSVLAHVLNLACSYSTHNSAPAGQLARDLAKLISPAPVAPKEMKRLAAVRRIDQDDPILAELPKHMQPKPIKAKWNTNPARNTVAELMERLIAEGQYKKCVRYYNHKLRLGMKPNQKILMLRLRLCSALTDVESALRVLRQLERYEIKPNHGVFHQIISICTQVPEKAGLVPLVIERMKAAGFEPSAATYTTLMTAYMKTDQIKEALNLYYQMEQLKIPPPVPLHLRLVSLLKRIGALDEAQSIFESVWIAVFDEIKLERMRSEVGSVGMELYLHVGKPEKAIEIWNTMRAGGIKPHREMIVSLAEAFKAAGLLTQARALFHQVRFQVSPSLDLYNVMIEVYGRHVGPEAAIAKYEQLRRLYTPDANTLRGLLSMFLHICTTRTDIEYEAVFKKVVQLLAQFNQEYNVDALRRADLSAILVQLAAICGKPASMFEWFLAFSVHDEKRTLQVPLALISAMHRAEILTEQQRSDEEEWLRSACSSALVGVDKSRLEPSDLVLSAEISSKFVEHIRSLQSSFSASANAATN